jgi:hypothetical protein
MHPTALDAIAGAQRPDVMDVATLARSLDYPPSQTGLTRSLGGQGEGLGRMLMGSEALGHLGAATGIPGGSTLGRVAGLGLMPALRYLRAQALEGPSAINALSGGAPPAGPSMAGLIAAINAANATQQNRNVQVSP